LVGIGELGEMFDLPRAKEGGGHGVLILSFYQYNI
jgi:hypothetical protein